MLSRLSLFVLSLLAGCAVVPRLPTDVSRAVNRDDMRLLRTAHVDLYYPVQHQQRAQALAERAEGCLSELRARTTANTGLSQQRIELIFPDLPFNNAFVNPPLNGDFFSVVPTYWSLDIVTETGLLPDPGYIACHELTHYVHAQQTFRTLSGLNKAFGYFITPQYGLDSWFWEGLATYYEQRLQPGTGRLAWPAWDGMFHAAVAHKRLDGGDFSELNRRLHWGHNYQYGSHFISFLVERYGELRLWKLIQRQGSSFFFPFIVNQRFKREYGKTLSALIDEYRGYLAEHYPARERPPAQQTVRNVGYNGRYARATDGTEAVIAEAMDDPPTLTVYSADGKVRYRKRLTEVLPPRKLVVPSAAGISGLRFSRDGKWLYFVALDQGVVFQRARLLALDLERERLSVVASDLGGLGGDVSPDGQSYLFVKVSGEGHVLSRYDFASASVTELYRAPAGVYLSSPNYAPDGRIVVSAFDKAYALWVFDSRGQRTDTLALTLGPVYDASFLEDGRLLFLGPHEGRFQAFVYDLSTERATRVTDAPYLAMQPRAYGGTVRFLNRDGFGYTLDQVTLPTASHAYNFAARTLADAADAGVPGAASEPPTFGELRAPGAPAVDAGQVEGAPVDAGQVEPTPVESAPVELAPGEPAPVESVPPTLAQPAPTGELAVVRNQPLALPPPATLPAPFSEHPYSVFPRLLIPSLRAPAVTIASQPGAGFLGAYVGGTDAFGKHRWGSTLGADPRSGRLSGALGYLNTQLSPLWLGITASQLSYDDYDARDSDPVIIYHDRHRQRDLTASAYLPLRTTQLELSLHATDDRQPDRTEALHHRFLSGGTLALLHDATERTPMTFVRRGYQAALSGSYYPEALGSLHSDLADLRGALRVVSPLPLYRRHTLSLGVRARGVLSGEPSRLLEVGGNQLSVLYDAPNAPDPDLHAYPGLPPRRRFREPLRGFETLPIQVDQIYIADLDYFLPIIIDRGTATSFSILPSFFLRQIELEAFVSGATSSTSPNTNNSHLAVGGALGLRFFWFGPFLVRYQLSKRLTDDDKLQHLITFGADIGDQGTY
ncbi:MAG TPA: hypothetical protein VI299_28045 [Polyangiales bacterium]